MCCASNDRARRLVTRLALMQSPIDSREGLERDFHDLTHPFVGDRKRPRVWSSLPNNFMPERRHISRTECGNSNPAESGPPSTPGSSQGPETAPLLLGMIGC
jgi:hypothetical protein